MENIMKKFALALSFLLALLVFAACTTPPTEEMNNAQDAVTRAENNADAVTFAGNTLIRARDALTRMYNEAEAKRYEDAKNLAAEAITLAERAIEEGMIAAIRARDEAVALLHGLAGPLEETSGALNAAGQDESLDLDVNGLSSDLDSAYRSYGEAQQQIQDSNFQGAIANGHYVRSTISGINAAITTAAQASRQK